MSLDKPKSENPSRSNFAETIDQYVRSPETLKKIREMPVNFNYQAVFCLGCGNPERNIKRSEYAAELALKKTVPYLVSGGMVSPTYKKMNITEADHAYRHVMSVPHYKEAFEKHKIHFERERKAGSTAANISNIIPYLKQNGITRLLIVTDDPSHARRAISRLLGLYPQVVVSFYTPNSPNIDSNISRGAMAEVSPEEGNKIARVATGDQVAQDILQTPSEESEPLPPPGAMHGSVLEKVNGISEEVANKDLEKLGNVPIKELRGSKLFLEDEKPDGKGKALGVKRETARRIKAYTSEQSGDWYKIDYSKMDSVKKDDVYGWTHEMDTGLGEILLDPDITDILVERNGKMIKARRGVVPAGQSSAGRVAFLDENGRYVSTHSGDRFRILKDGETDIEKSSDEYMARYDEEAKSRDSHSKAVSQLVEPPEADDEATAPSTASAGIKEDPDKEDPEDEGGGPAPTNLTYDSTPGADRLRLGTRQLPYRFFSTSVRNQSGKEILVTNGGAPGRSTPSGKKREAFKDDWAISQLRELYSRGIRVVVSLAAIENMKRAISKLEKEGVKMELISRKYECTPPDSRNLVLFDKVGNLIRQGKSVYIHCTHGTHRAPSCATGTLIAAGIATSFAHALQLAKLDPRNFNSKYRKAMLKQLADFARSKGLKVESAKEYSKYTSNAANINLYRQVLG
ncbi:MAG: ElyC/SanA/YdcF family protein [Candidatus Gracilibacteria bacterium]|nr:ElyC/SanA/YdcF family protein [Candidatus Gracilibacteria bacterium]